MSDVGRGTMTGPDEFAERERVNTRRRFAEGQYDEMFLPVGEETQVLLQQGKFLNRIWSQTQQKLVEKIDTYKGFFSHRVPPELLTLQYIEKRYGKGKEAHWANVRCSAGPDPSRPGPCLPCEAPSAAARKRQYRVAWSALHLAGYHVTPSSTDSRRTYLKLCMDGRRYDKDGKAVPCAGCEKKLEIVDGARRYFDMSEIDLEVIIKKNAWLRRKCACGGDLVTIALHCNLCNGLVMNRTADNTREFDRIIDEKNPEQYRSFCPVCGVKVVCQEKKDCSKCGNPRIRNVFNSVLTLVREKGERYTNLIIQETCSAGDVPERFSSIMQPLDLEAIFSPLTLREQSDIVDARKVRGESPMSESRSKP